MLNLIDKNRKWWVLLAMSSSLALVFIDQTALAVALPAIQRELNLSSTFIQWIINAYLLALSTLILLGGKLGDTLGHKRIFLFGVIVFISASILCAIAPSGTWLIVTRIIQGMGGAFMMPSTNAIVVNAFPENERGKAIGIYVALAAVFLASGPLLGGALTQVFSWRAVFWINFPIALTSIILAILAVPNETYTEKFKIDWLGFFISTSFISGFVLSLMEGPNWGWTSLPTISLFLFSLLALIAFIFWERRIDYPLVELKLFKNPIFSIVTAVIIIIQTVGVVFIFWAIFVQNVLQYSPLQAGLLLLPSMLPIIFMAPIGGHLRDQYGPTFPMSSGCLLVTASLIWIGAFCHTESYLWLFPGLLAYGIGMPLILAGSMTSVMNTVTAQQRGIAGAVLNCARQSGNSIGLAVLAGLLESINKWRLTSFLNQSAPPLADIKEKQIDGLLVHSTQALKAISHLPIQSIDLLKTAALKAYINAFSTTMYVAAALALLSLFLILKIPPRKK